MGAEDTRTRGQRYHDGLHEAMRRLAASGLLPERAGQPVKAWAHVSLAELRALDAGSVLQGQWITAVQARWAGARASASVAGGDGAAWLHGAAARAVTCDAIITPVVTQCRLLSGPVVGAAGVVTVWACCVNGDEAPGRTLRSARITRLRREFRCLPIVPPRCLLMPSFR
jgi:hypothetical protein